MSTHPSKMSRLDRWSYHFGKWLLIVIGCSVLVLFVAAPYLTTVSHLPPAFVAVDNARTISNALHAYAEEHHGRYPDGVTANSLLRHLLALGIIDNELLFSAKNSPHQPDLLIGEAPDYAQALEPGECHWAVMRGMNINDPGHLALLFENPVNQTWPPVWDLGEAGKPVPGRAQKGGKIVIGRNDGSIAIEALVSYGDNRVPVQDPTLFSHDPARLLDPPFAMPEPLPATD